MNIFVHKVCFEVKPNVCIHFGSNKSCFKGSYDKHNLTLVVILYEIYETSRRSSIFKVDMEL